MALYGGVSRHNVDQTIQGVKTFSGTLDVTGTFKIGGVTVSATAAQLNSLNGVTAGTVAASKAMVVDANKNLAWTTTSASTDGGTSVEPLSMVNTMTGAGGVGGRAKFRLDSNVALGGWCNALKGHTVFGASGRVTGLASAIVGELQLSAGCTEGTYAPLESEIVLPASAVTGTASSFLYGAASGANVSEFDDNGFFFELAGLTASSNGTKLLDADTKAGIAKTHTLKVRINGTTYYMPLHTSKDMGGS